MELDFFSAGLLQRGVLPVDPVESREPAPERPEPPVYSLCPETYVGTGND